MKIPVKILYQTEEWGPTGLPIITRYFLDPETNFGYVQHVDNQQMTIMKLNQSVNSEDINKTIDSYLAQYRGRLLSINDTLQILAYGEAAGECGDTDTREKADTLTQSVLPYEKYQRFKKRIASNGRASVTKEELEKYLMGEKVDWFS